MGKVGVGKKSKKGGKGGNAGVGVDFKRVKHKVGKKLPKAQNETNVSFKSASIALPNQTIQQDREGMALNFQNLSLQELLKQSGHYSEKARRHALQGLADLFTRHPAELRQHTHMFFTKVAERVGDGDAAVRQALRSLLREQVLPLLSAGMVRPFMPVLMAHVSSAMTNLNMQVRLDALQFMDVLMDCVPELVVAGFEATCLLHFCDLLSQAHRGRSIKSQSVSSLLKVVEALNSYLRRAYSSNTHATTPQQPQQQPSGRAAKKGGASAASAAAGGPASSNNNSGDPVAGGVGYAAVTLGQDRTAWPPRAAGPGGDAPTLPQLPICSVLCPAAPGAGAGARAGVGAGGGIGKLRTGPPPPTTGTPGNALMAASGGSAPAPGVGAGAGAGAAEGATAVGDVKVLAMRLVSLLFDCWSECGPTKAVEGPDLEPLLTLNGILSAVSTITSAILLPTTTSASPSSPDGIPAPGGPSAMALPVLLWLADLALRRVAPVFPAASPSVKPSATLMESLMQFNLQAAQLLAMLLPVAPSHGGPWVQALLGFYVGVMQRGEVLPARGALSEAASVTGAGAATNAAYLSVLRGVGAAVLACDASAAYHTPHGDDPYAMPMQQQRPAQPRAAPGAGLAAGPAESAAAGGAEQLLAAVEALAVRMQPRSPVRAECVRLQHALMAHCRAGQLALSDETVARWVAPLPRLLWELGGDAPEVSRLALVTLLDAARFAGPSVALRTALTALQPQLGPLFCVHMPARKPPAVGGAQGQGSGQGQLVLAGSCGACCAERAEAEAQAASAKAAAAGAAAQAPATLVPGPVSKLPEDLQLLAIDLLHHLGRLEAPLLKALAAAVHDPRVLPSAEAALRLTEVTLSRLPDMETPTAASWALTLLFASQGTAGSASTPAGTVGGASATADWTASQKVSERQKAVTERACASLPGWASVDVLFKLLEQQLGLLLAGSTAALTDQQRYSLVRLASLTGRGQGDGVDGMEGVEGPAVAAGSGRGSAKGKGRGKGKEEEGGGQSVLPGVVLQALPAVCFEWYSGQQQGLLGAGSNAGSSVGLSGVGAAGQAGVFSQAAAASAAEAAATATVLQLLQMHTQSLLLPLVQHCVALCQARCGPSVDAGQSKGTQGKGKQAKGKQAKPQQGKGLEAGEGHSVECMRGAFRAATALLQAVLQYRALGPSLLRQQQGVQQQLAELAAVAQSSPQLSGDTACRAAAKQLEQVARDLFGA